MKSLFLLVSIALISGCAAPKMKVETMPPAEIKKIQAGALVVNDRRTFDAITSGHCVSDKQMDYQGIVGQYFSEAIDRTSGGLTIDVTQFQYCTADSGGAFVNIIPILGGILYNTMETFFDRIYFNATFTTDRGSVPVEVRVQQTRRGVVSDFDVYRSQLFTKALSKAQQDFVAHSGGMKSAQ